MLYHVRLLCVKQNKSDVDNNKFWKEMNFPYQEGALLLPRSNDWS